MVGGETDFTADGRWCGEKRLPFTCASSYQRQTARPVVRYYGTVRRGIFSELEAPSFRHNTSSSTTKTYI